MTDDPEAIQIPGLKMIDFVEKVDEVIKRIIEEIPERSIALDVALLDLRDACKALADSINNS